MTHSFDGGYAGPFRTLCEDYPGAEAYPPDAFRTDSPPWMRGAANWAARTGSTPGAKRATITVTVPKAFRP